MVIEFEIDHVCRGVGHGMVHVMYRHVMSIIHGHALGAWMAQFPPLAPPVPCGYLRLDVR